MSVDFAVRKMLLSAWSSILNYFRIAYLLVVPERLAVALTEGLNEIAIAFLISGSEFIAVSTFLIFWQELYAVSA
jgi:hypothetical protein